MFQIPDNQKNITVGLSGGGDSMALAHMMCEWAQENDRTIHFLTVDHRLRDYSTDEALQVAEWVKGWKNCKHHILTWNYDEKPKTAIMEKARQARYALMAEYCTAHDIQTLVIAHHGDDQIETFFFRLSKGSGLDGLTGMRTWTHYNENLDIYRPLLHKSHQDLIDYCVKYNLKWVEDPSNEDDKYTRINLRKSLQKEGFKLNRFQNTLERLARAQEALDKIAESFLLSQRRSQSMSEVDSGLRRSDEIVIDFKILQKHPRDIQIRVLQKCLRDFGETTHNYPPKLERVEEIIATLRPSQSATLHGCLITLSKDGNVLEVKRT